MYPSVNKQWRWGETWSNLIWFDLIDLTWFDSMRLFVTETVTFVCCLVCLFITAAAADASKIHILNASFPCTTTATTSPLYTMYFKYYLLLYCSILDPVYSITKPNLQWIMACRNIEMCCVGCDWWKSGMNPTCYYMIICPRLFVLPVGCLMAICAQ